MSVKEQFSNRWGLIFATLAMAIGAGNIWRFPRLAGQYGGTFILLWLLFLLIWAIPIVMAEFAIGKSAKKSVIASMKKFNGNKLTWMGVFVAVCSLMIAFYYGVVVAWALKYLIFAIQNFFASSDQSLNQLLITDPNYLKELWQNNSNMNILTLILFVITVIAAAWVLFKGIQNGLEKINKILIPTLFVFLILMAAFSLSLDGAIKGLDYMFHIDFDLFKNPTIWIEALTQAAWSTGAGWGLIMTIASYSRQKEDVTLNSFITGFGDNTASLLAAFAVLPAVFGLASSELEAVNYLKSGNQGLTFTIIPALFTKIPAGSILMILFFISLTMAAFSSVLPMYELFIKSLDDLGVTRSKAVIRVAFIAAIFGLPSALSLSVFENQDWVWGIGLILSGFFIVLTILKYGAIAFKENFIDPDSDFKINNLFFKSVLILNAGLAVFLIVWWMSQGYSEYPWFDAQGSWNVWDMYSNATIVTQWATVLVLAIFFNQYLAKKFGD